MIITLSLYRSVSVIGEPREFEKEPILWNLTGRNAPPDLVRWPDPSGNSRGDSDGYYFTINPASIEIEGIRMSADYFECDPPVTVGKL